MKGHFGILNVNCQTAFKGRKKISYVTEWKYQRANTTYIL